MDPLGCARQGTRQPCPAREGGSLYLQHKEIQDLSVQQKQKQFWGSSGLFVNEVKQCVQNARRPGCGLTKQAGSRTLAKARSVWEQSCPTRVARWPGVGTGKG